MATGWPMKTTYANGDVYSASDVNDITGTINLLQTSTLSLQGGKNAIINGGFDFWQRGTSFVPSTVGATSYNADRWSMYRNATGSTITRQLTSDTTNCPNIQYCSRVSRDSGNTSTAVIIQSAPVEIAQALPFVNGKTVTMSYYARKGANYSPTSSLLNVVVLAGTGTNDTNPNFFGYTGQYAPLNTTVTLTTTWQRFTHTFTFAAADTQFMPYFQMNPTGTAGAADYFEVTGLQVERGSYATTFSRAGGTIQGELAACQRYYWRTVANNTVALYAPAVAQSTTVGNGMFTMPVTMRTNPTSIDYSNLAFRDYPGSLFTMSAVTLDAFFYTPNMNMVYGTISGATAGRVGQITANGTTSSYIGFSAEL